LLLSCSIAVSRGTVPVLTACQSVACWLVGLLSVNGDGSGRPAESSSMAKLACSVAARDRTVAARARCCAGVGGLVCVYEAPWNRLCGSRTMS